MLIDHSLVKQSLDHAGIKLEGILHAGAHDCEELGVYQFFGVPAPRIHWVEAMGDKVAIAEDRGIPNVYQAVLSDVDGESVTFHVSNNGQSSSFMDLKEHAIIHPTVHYVRSFPAHTVTIDTLLEKRGVDASQLTFWNVDLQGADLKALRGGVKAMAHAKAIYCEVNTKEMYEGCPLIEEVDAFLETQGFYRAQTRMTDWGWGDALYIRRRPTDAA